ncbi:MAG: hypothetical protein M0P23_00445 [Bacteroidales bacterium]|jgi:hypothetical protein|nr:hypothetical protein [Bacteroidales bacterium]NLB03114.1 hypothetical protein [Bacteroidales bacterium]
MQSRNNIRKNIQAQSVVMTETETETQNQSLNHGKNPVQAQVKTSARVLIPASFESCRRRTFFHSLPIILALFLFWSCGEDSPLACEETYFVSNDKQEWLSEDSIGDSFVMTDQNGISQSFTMHRNNREFNKSWGGYFFITTHRTYREYFYQNYSSTYQWNYSLSLSALWEPYGDEIRAEVGSTSFTYNFNYECLSRLECGEGNLDKLMTDQGYEEDFKSYSSVKFLDSLRVGNTVYKELLHFTCLDLAEEWEEYTVKEIYLAKHYGLIQYKLQNGLVYSRD